MLMFHFGLVVMTLILGKDKDFFKGEIAEVKMWNHYDDLVLHYDMTKSICCDQGCRRCKGELLKI